MAHRLADLLEHNHPLFGYNLAQLERASGNSGIDTRLLAEIAEKSARIVREIGLDVRQANVQEIYYALRSLDEERRHGLLADTPFILMLRDGKVISFNQRDIADDLARDAPFDDRQLENAKRELRNEILGRYMASDRTDNMIVKRLITDAGLDVNFDRKVEEDKVSDAIKFLCVGDIITDAFIKLSEDYAKSYTDEQGYQRLSFELGAKLPYESVDIVQAVECSPNAAVSLSRLGLHAELMSWIGDDETGKEMVSYLQGQNVGTNEIIVEPGMKSNYHYVLRYGADRTKLQRFEDYSYQWHDPAVKPDWLYLGVLGEKTWPLHEAMLDYLNRNPDIKLVFQPGMYHLMWGSEKMAEFYRRAEIVIMNREEAAEVTGRDRGDVKQLIWSLHDMGVTVAVVTDGAAGAYASDGHGILFMPNYPDPKPPLDRTGAGDAFASTIAAALALGEPLETALLWAPINSMSVVQQMGAQTGLVNREQLDGYLASKPEDYHSSSFES